jgi:hypothetical protein
MIVSNKFVKSKYGQPLRAVLAKHAAIRRITDFAGARVFRGATVRTLVLATDRTEQRTPNPAQYIRPPTVEELRSLEAGTLTVADFASANTVTIAATSLGSGDWAFGSEAVTALTARLTELHTRLGDYPGAQICMGVKSGLSKAFVVSQDVYDNLVADDPALRDLIVPVLNGRDIRRYTLEWPRTYLIFTYHGIDVRKHKGLLAHLAPFRKKLEARATKQEWYELQQPQQRFAEFMRGPKIIFPDIAKQTRFALDTSGHFGTNTTYFIPGADLALLGLLNSRFAQFYFQQVCAGLEGQDGTYLRFFGQYLENFPVPRATDLKTATGADVRALVELVESAISLHASTAAAKTAHERSAIQRHLSVIEQKIDALVYALYEFGADDIRVVEEATVTQS